MHVEVLEALTVEIRAEDRATTKFTAAVRSLRRELDDLLRLDDDCDCATARLERREDG